MCAASKYRVIVNANAAVMGFRSRSENEQMCTFERSERTNVQEVAVADGASTARRLLAVDHVASLAEQVTRTNPSAGLVNNRLIRTLLSLMYVPCLSHLIVIRTTGWWLHWHCSNWLRRLCRQVFQIAGEI